MKYLRLKQIKKDVNAVGLTNFLTKNGPDTISPLAEEDALEFKSRWSKFRKNLALMQAMLDSVE